LFGNLLLPISPAMSTNRTALSMRTASLLEIFFVIKGSVKRQTMSTIQLIPVAHKSHSAFTVVSSVKEVAEVFHGFQEAKFGGYRQACGRLFDINGGPVRSR